MNSVLILNGSLRENGNTDTLINKLIDGISEVNTRTKQINIRDLNINDCLGCYFCVENQKCIQKDSMTNVYKEIESADIIIFASPLYWSGVPGSMKKLIDRMFLYYYNKDLIKGKKAIVLSVFNQKNITHETEVVKEFYSRFFSALDIKDRMWCDFGGLWEKNSAADNKEYLEKAYNIGRNI